MKYSVHTHNLIPLITLYTNQIYLPIDWKWYSPLSLFLLINIIKYLSPMPGDIGKSHWICEYIRCNHKKYFIWAYAEIILNPLSPSLTFTLLLHQLFLSYTEPSNPPFKIFIVETFLRDIIRLVYSTTLTPSVISLPYLIYTYINAS